LIRKPRLRQWLNPPCAKLSTQPRAESRASKTANGAVIRERLQERKNALGGYVVWCRPTGADPPATQDRVVDIDGNERQQITAGRSATCKTRAGTHPYKTSRRLYQPWLVVPVVTAQIIEGNFQGYAPVNKKPKVRRRRFLAVLNRYSKAPEVTRLALYPENGQRLWQCRQFYWTMQSGGGVVPRLPLDEVRRPTAYGEQAK
jgi:membrane protease subunit HflK